ncbi:hypothetical protein HPB47_024714 [Ixodes persulcatus]|uniref:Uncharacterized protein n=1 Tax=Ixodes persulcatus TaxID=34615 RepID=A0AC60Q3Z5_IXOPE|nr:hypothetical protein HPB47_024714 [Ixodes persulcatus]
MCGPKMAAAWFRFQRRAAVLERTFGVSVLWEPIHKEVPDRRRQGPSCAKGARHCKPEQYLKRDSRLWGCFRLGNLGPVTPDSKRTIKGARQHAKTNDSGGAQHKDVREGERDKRATVEVKKGTWMRREDREDSETERASMVEGTTARHQVAKSRQDDIAPLQQGRAPSGARRRTTPTPLRHLISSADLYQTHLVDLASIVECQPAAAPRRSMSQANVPVQQGTPRLGGPQAVAVTQPDTGHNSHFRRRPQRRLYWKNTPMPGTSHSRHTEKEGQLRSVAITRYQELTVQSLSTDRQRSIAQHLREKELAIHHFFDVWHVSTTVNHMYWCTAASHGNRDLLMEAWSSMTSHMINLHEGHPGGNTRCPHVPVKVGE